MGVEHHGEVGRVLEALSENHRGAARGPQQFDIEPPGLEHSSKPFGVDFHVFEVCRGVGQGDEGGQFAHDLDFVLRTVLPHLVPDFRAVASFGDRSSRRQYEDAGKREHRVPHDASSMRFEGPAASDSRGFVVGVAN